MRSEHAHDLALLLIVLACGSVGDLTQSPINDEAEKYHTLTEVALTVRNIMHGASLSGVQTVYLLGSYDVYSGRKSSQEDAWKLIALGNSLAASVSISLYHKSLILTHKHSDRFTYVELILLLADFAVANSLPRFD